MRSGVLRRWHCPTLAEQAVEVAVVAVPCAACGRIVAPHAAIFWRSDHTWHCRDAASCAETRRRNLEPWKEMGTA